MAKILKNFTEENGDFKRLKNGKNRIPIRQDQCFCFARLCGCRKKSSQKLKILLEKNSIQLRQLSEKFISFLFISSCFYLVFLAWFFDGLGIEYPTFAKFVYIFIPRIY